MNKYMHLCCLQPGYFDGDQICLGFRNIKMSELLVNSLQQIRREQRATKKYREFMGFEVAPTDYSYILIKMDKP